MREREKEREREREKEERERKERERERAQHLAAPPLHSSLPPFPHPVIIVDEFCAPTTERKKDRKSEGRSDV